MPPVRRTLNSLIRFGDGHPVARNAVFHFNWKTFPNFSRRICRERVFEALLICTCGGGGIGGWSGRIFDQKRFGSSKWSAEGSSPEGAEYAGGRWRSAAVFGGAAGAGRRPDMRRVTGSGGDDDRCDGQAGPTRSCVTSSEWRSQRLLGFAGRRTSVGADAERHVQNFLVKWQFLAQQAVALHFLVLCVYGRNGRGNDCLIRLFPTQHTVSCVPPTQCDSRR